MADKKDGFASVCYRMQALMREQPRGSACREPSRLDDMIHRLGAIAAGQRAA
ncbi:hypothetical protein BH11PSE5_BH11PSE5_04580 [soil metagenome]